MLALGVAARRQQPLAARQADVAQVLEVAHEVGPVANLAVDPLRLRRRRQRRLDLPRIQQQARLVHERPPQPVAVGDQPANPLLLRLDGGGARHVAAPDVVPHLVAQRRLQPDQVVPRPAQRLVLAVDPPCPLHVAVLQQDHRLRRQRLLQPLGVAGLTAHALPLPEQRQRGVVFPEAGQRRAQHAQPCAHLQYTVRDECLDRFVILGERPLSVLACG